MRFYILWCVLGEARSGQQGVGKHRGQNLLLLLGTISEQSWLKYNSYGSSLASCMYVQLLSLNPSIPSSPIPLVSYPSSPRASQNALFLIPIVNGAQIGLVSKLSYLFVKASSPNGNVLWPQDMRRPSRFSATGGKFGTVYNMSSLPCDVHNPWRKVVSLERQAKEEE